MSGLISPASVKAAQATIITVTSDPLARQDAMRTAQRHAMSALTNRVRSDTVKAWRAAVFRRSGKRLHRRAIARGVRAKVRATSSGVVGVVGISRRDRYASIVNVLDPGFTHKATGARIPGKGIRAAMIATIPHHTPRYRQMVNESFRKLIAGAIGKVKY